MCETTKEKDASKYPSNDQKKIYSSAIKADRKDLWLERESILKCFKTLTYDS